MGSEGIMEDIRKQKLIARFWRYTDKKAPGDCWLWKGARKGGKGSDYGSLDRVRAHRLSWMIHSDQWDLPSSVFICHRCDVPLCVNPSHLFAGSHADNMADMVAKGRARSVMQPKLSRASIIELSRFEGHAQVAADRYGVSLATAQAIMSGRRHSAVTGIVPVPDRRIKITHEMRQQILTSSASAKEIAHALGLCRGVIYRVRSGYMAQNIRGGQ